MFSVYIKVLRKQANPFFIIIITEIAIAKPVARPCQGSLHGFRTWNNSFLYFYATFYVQYGINTSHCYVRVKSIDSEP